MLFRSYPVYEVPASGVNVIVWNFDWNDKIGMWIESATISAVSYDTAAKSYTVLQENAVQWHESPLETENGEPTLEGSWVQLTQPGTYLIDIRYAVVAGGCIAVVTIPEAETAGGETPAAAGFTDVKPGDWFAEPVKWAVERKITEGTGNGQFSPSKTCTKGQIITFIWRANGSPEPDAAKISAFSGNPFPDLTGEEYYYTAALWAYTQGMTAGGLAFDGAEPCTRASAVYYIWAAAGEPAPGGKAGFTDLIPALHSVDAIAWAVERGVTEGTGNNTFSPDKPCTRGQIVTFLYRALG